MARVIGPIATALAVSETQTGVDVSVQFDAPGGWQRLRPSELPRSDQYKKFEAYNIQLW